ncbi:DUF2225 domain-containing protein [Chitinispirillales bacterium ANBcel5]|uniref:DUF2225 domain-containing protein n=1 Tax=Cellulosispirillum alkaliphilum TaxID=3039283 RepID=UPI002A5524BF|nr:DUF2225 domain-containing protein [Chitinispirillales bacterium ANBcel5]
MAINVNEVKRRLLVLLNNPNLVNEYIRQYGPTIDIKCIKAVKESQKRNIPPDAKHQDGDDPIFEIKAKCPVCNKEEITGYELRAKTQQVTQNRFLVPSYTGTQNYNTVDYSLIAVTICPRCLYASPDKKDFIRHQIASGVEVKSQLSGSILITLQEKIGERKALLNSITDYETYFVRPRYYDSAMDSYRLAMSRAKVEAWYELPYSYYKLGSYALRIAKIMKDSSLDDTETLEEALSYFEVAFRTSNCPAEDLEMQVIYLIIAINIRLNDFNKANSYISVFSNLKNTRIAEMKENPQLTTTIIDKWNDRAKFLWEDRHCPSLFE